MWNTDRFKQVFETPLRNKSEIHLETVSLCTFWLHFKVPPTYSSAPSPSLNHQAAVERVKTPCLHLSPEPYQYSWVCRVRLCDGCLISLWSPCARPVGALMRQQQSSVWSAERTAACIDLHILSLPSTRASTHTQMLPTGAWIHASTVGLHLVQSDVNTATAASESCL